MMSGCIHACMMGDALLARVDAFAGLEEVGSLDDLAADVLEAAARGELALSSCLLGGRPRAGLKAAACPACFLAFPLVS